MKFVCVISVFLLLFFVLIKAKKSPYQDLYKKFHLEAQSKNTFMLLIVTDLIDIQNDVKNEIGFHGRDITQTILFLFRNETKNDFIILTYNYKHISLLLLKRHVAIKVIRIMASTPIEYHFLSSKPNHSGSPYQLRVEWSFRTAFHNQIPSSWKNIYFNSSSVVYLKKKVNGAEFLHYRISYKTVRNSEDETNNQSFVELLFREVELGKNFTQNFVLIDRDFNLKFYFLSEGLAVGGWKRIELIYNRRKIIYLKFRQQQKIPQQLKNDHIDKGRNTCYIKHILKHLGYASTHQYKYTKQILKCKINAGIYPHFLLQHNNNALYYRSLLKDYTIASF
ncbi:hypothetical protein Avbf_05396 [Armadillidium vulgare]|nr:hypothetical protein Avbf_05396 [Armadillidium vulgare]